MNDGDAVGEVGEVVMRDRELLGEDGVILLSVNINPRTKKIITPLQIVSKGFAYLSEHPEFEEKIVEEFQNVADKYLSQPRIDWAEFKSDIRNAESRLIYKAADANPIIIPVLISTDPAHLLVPKIDMSDTKKGIKKAAKEAKAKASASKEKKVDTEKKAESDTKTTKKTVKPKTVKKLTKTDSKEKTVKKVVRKKPVKKVENNTTNE
jgi:hypothetical protein